MDILKIILIGYGLSADAFACSVVASMQSDNKKIPLLCSLTFGAFQGIMPFLGYVLSMGVNKYLSQIDHFIAFILLSIIGINMIKERDKEDNDFEYSLKTIMVLGIATSIDAFAVGCTLSLINMPVIVSCWLIASITFLLCLIASFIGRKIGHHHANTSKLIGGIILIIIGVHTLIEHLMV